MKRLLLPVLLLTCISTVHAQRLGLWDNDPPEHRWDVGVNLGGSIITRPLGPQDAYTGDKTSIVADYGVRVVRSLGEHWNVALDIGFRKWESNGTWYNNYYGGKKLNPTPIRFQMGRPAISQSVQLNYVIPTYSRFRKINRSNLYFGVLFGLVTTVSDGSTQYSKYNAEPDSSYRYVSGYNYGAGIGYSFGGQVGYTYYVLRRWGINAEFSTRYADVGTEKVNGIHNAHMTNRFRTVYFAQTFGIRYRFK
jgi:hypothetical protein